MDYIVTNFAEYIDVTHKGKMLKLNRTEIETKNSVITTSLIGYNGGIYSISRRNDDEVIYCVRLE